MEFESKGICKCWTKSSIECYKRGCNCNGCLIGESLETHCYMKRSVMELVRKLGAPPDKENKLSKQEQKVVDAILYGASTHDDIASVAQLKKENVKSILTRLYPLAEFDGVIYKDPRYKLKDFIQWVRCGYEYRI